MSINKFILLFVVIFCNSCSTKREREVIYLEEHPEVESKDKRTITIALQEYKEAVYLINPSANYSHIDSGAMKGLVHVKYINFSSNWFQDDGNLEELNNCSNVEELYLNFNKLTKIPEWNFRNIKKMTLYHNLIERWDNYSCRFKSLNYLGLGGNKLRNFPDSINDLSALDTLDLSGNSITIIPVFINLPNLKFLDIRQNSLIDINGIKGFPKLTQLILSENQLSYLPDSIVNLIALNELFVSGNHLRQLPSGISKLKNLKGLSLSNNNFDSFPSELLKMPQLEYLSFENNSVKLSEEEKESIRKQLPGTKIKF